MRGFSATVVVVVCQRNAVVTNHVVTVNRHLLCAEMKLSRLRENQFYLIPRHSSQWSLWLWLSDTCHNVLWPRSWRFLTQVVHCVEDHFSSSRHAFWAKIKPN